MMDLIDYCARHNIDQILELPDVKERVDLYIFNMKMNLKNSLKNVQKFIIT